MYTRSLVLISTLLVFSAKGKAQEFEVASIRLNRSDDSGVEGRRISVRSSPGGVIMGNVTLTSCIRWAYDVHDFQIVGGPAWRSSERYDISARTASPASQEELRFMLQQLLADRFRLRLKHEVKEMAVYKLTVENPAKLKRSKAEGLRGMRPLEGGLVFENTTMSDLEQFLTTLPSMDRPVLDRTRLEGQFDFTLLLFDIPVSAEPLVIKNKVSGADPSVYMEALQRIGLVLKPEKESMQALIIAHAEKPSEN
jgi:uncharacterized protein (TIGR03435 family)